MKVAVIQMVSGPDAEENYSRAEALLRKAQSQGVDIAVLPENFVTYGQKKKPDLSSQQDFLSRMGLLSKSLGVWLVAGSYPLNGSSLQIETPSRDNSSPEKPYAASVIFNDAGEIAEHYLKIHLFDALVADSVKTYRESDEFQYGKEAKAINSPFCTFGVTICYDLRFPELFSQLTSKGCKVIFIPSAFTEATGRAHWEILLRARAIETQCYIVAANQGGVHERGRATWGHSMIVSPWGEILAQLETGEGVLVEELDLGALDVIRSNMPVQQHRRLT